MVSPVFFPPKKTTRNINLNSCLVLAPTVSCARRLCSSRRGEYVCVFSLDSEPFLWLTSAYPVWAYLRILALVSKFDHFGTQMSFAEPRHVVNCCIWRRPYRKVVGGYVREEGASSCGGDVGRLRASAPLRGSLRRLFTVPFRTSPPSRGALRSAGVPTIAANTTLAPQRSRGI